MNCFKSWIIFLCENKISHWDLKENEVLNPQGTGGVRLEYNDECEMSIIKVTSVNTTRRGISEIIFSRLEKKNTKQNIDSHPERCPWVIHPHGNTTSTLHSSACCESQPVIKGQCQRAALWRCTCVTSSVSKSHRGVMGLQHRTDLGPITYSNTAEAIHYTGCAWILTPALTDGADSWSIVARLDQSMALPLPPVTLGPAASAAGLICPPVSQSFVFTFPFHLIAAALHRRPSSLSLRPDGDLYASLIIAEDGAGSRSFAQKPLLTVNVC